MTGRAPEPERQETGGTGPVPGPATPPPSTGTGTGGSTGTGTGSGTGPATSGGTGPGTGGVPIVPVEGRTPWQHYIDLIRALDSERAAEEARTAGRRQGAEAAALEVERLSPLLIDQGAELAHLARRLRLSHPRLAAEPREVDATPYELAVLATRATARAGSYAREAHQLATRPRFLPGWPAGLRNFAIYLLWALAAVAVQYGVVEYNTTRSTTPPLALVLLVIPGIAFLGGLVTVSTLGRAPLALEQVGRSARMGALICFGIFPVGILLVIARAWIHHG